MHKKAIVVSNSTILIAMSILESLDILKKLYGQIIIPEEVFIELTTIKNKPASDIKKYDWIKVKKVSDNKFKKFLSFDLHKGEAETIALSEELQADIVLIDDYWAREFAKNLKMNVVGTIGILIKSKQNKYITQLKPLLDKLIRNGFWIDKSLYKMVLKEVEELK